MGWIDEIAAIGKLRKAQLESEIADRCHTDNLNLKESAPSGYDGSVREERSTCVGRKTTVVARVTLMAWRVAGDQKASSTAPMWSWWQFDCLIRNRCRDRCW